MWRRCGARLGVMALVIGLLSGASGALAQRHGMMQPRVPAEKLSEARALTNPLPDSPEIVEQGKSLYEGKGGCVKCHGLSGRGDGEAAATLNPAPRNFRHHGFWRHRSEGEIFWVIKHGITGTSMIAFGSQLSDEEIWSIIRYERTFARGHGPRGRRGPHAAQGPMGPPGGMGGGDR